MAARGPRPLEGDMGYVSASSSSSGSSSSSEEDEGAAARPVRRRPPVVELVSDSSSSSEDEGAARPVRRPPPVVELVSDSSSSSSSESEDESAGESAGEEAEPESEPESESDSEPESEEEEEEEEPEQEPEQEEEEPEPEPEPETEQEEEEQQPDYHAETEIATGDPRGSELSYELGLEDDDAEEAQDGFSATRSLPFPVNVNVNVNDNRPPQDAQDQQDPQDNPQEPEVDLTTALAQMRTLPRAATLQSQGERLEDLAAAMAGRPAPAHAAWTVFLVGGPGSGRRSVARLLARRRGCVHLDLADADADDADAAARADRLRTAVLHAKTEVTSATSFIVVTGFLPDAVDDALPLSRSKAVYLEAPLGVLQQRLLASRAASSAAQAHRRVTAFWDQEMPALQRLARLGLLRVVNAAGVPGQVYRRVLDAVEASAAPVPFELLPLAQPMLVTSPVPGAADTGSRSGSDSDSPRRTVPARISPAGAASPPPPESRIPKPKPVPQHTKTFEPEPPVQMPPRQQPSPTVAPPTADDTDPERQRRRRRRKQQKKKPLSDVAKFLNEVLSDDIWVEASSFSDLETELRAWLVSLELSKPVHSIEHWRRDFCNGYLVAEILAQHFPGEIALHSFEPGSSSRIKRANWDRLTTFFRRHDVPVSRQDMADMAGAVPGTVVRVLERVHAFLAQRKLVLPMSWSPSVGSAPVPVPVPGLGAAPRRRRRQPKPVVALRPVPTPRTGGFPPSSSSARQARPRPRGSAGSTRSTRSAAGPAPAPAPVPAPLPPPGMAFMPPVYAPPAMPVGAAHPFPNAYPAPMFPSRPAPAMQDSYMRVQAMQQAQQARGQAYMEAMDARRYRGS